MRANDIIHNIVKDKLKRDEVVASMTVRLVRGVEIARLAATAGFDMIYVDLEHSTLTLEATGQICQAALSAGVTPMVRVPANTPDYIQRVLDAGALGIIAPGVRSAEEARGCCGLKVCAARRTRGWWRPAAAAVPVFPGRRGERCSQRRHHGDLAVRIRRGGRQSRADCSRRGCRHGADRRQ